jgi:hypothetical protein
MAFGSGFVYDPKPSKRRVEAILRLTAGYCILQVRTPRLTPTAPTLSLIPTVNGNTVRGFHYARTTVRSPKKLNHGLVRTSN